MIRKTCALLLLSPLFLATSLAQADTVKIYNLSLIHI